MTGETVPRYGDTLRAAFPDLDPRVEDLFLIDSHEVGELARRVDGRDLAVVLRAHPELHQRLVLRDPASAAAIEECLAAHVESPDEADALTACEDAALWDVADLICYHRAPAYYDVRSRAMVAWTPAAVTDVVDLRDAVVVDGGAGTGRVTRALAPLAREVIAVEPVAALRRFLRDRCATSGLRNVRVVHGLLDALPLPDDSVDVVVTLQSLGWRLPEELAEIARVLCPGGTSIHLFGVPAAGPTDAPMFAALLAAGSVHDIADAGGSPIHRYVRNW